jgi:hypothetical protein
MLRIVLALLVLANVVAYGWMRGWFEPSWPSPERRERESARLAAQVRPDAVVVLPPGAASAALQAARSAAVRCVEAGPFNAAEADAAEAALAAAGIAAGSWQRESVQPGVPWVVFAGRYPEAEARAARAAELRRARLVFETLGAPPELAPGFVLSRHPSREAAESALKALRGTGLRELSVVSLPAPPPEIWLRAARADVPLRAQLQALAGANGALAGGFRSCVGAP